MLGGAAEHKMFKQVRDAGATELLVARADLVPHLQRNHRGMVVFEHHDR